MSSGDPSRCYKCGARLSEHATICPNCFSYVTPPEDETGYEEPPYEEDYYEEEPYEEEPYEPEPIRRPPRPRRPVEPPARRRPPPRRRMPERAPRPRGIPVYPEPMPWKRIAVIVILGIILLCTIVIGLLSPSWYHAEFVLFDTQMEFTYGLYEVKAKVVGVPEVSIKYSEMDDELGSDDEAYSVIKITRGLLYLGLIFTILFLITVFLGAAGNLDIMEGRGPAIIGFIAALIVLIATAYFAIAFPDKVAESMPPESAPSDNLMGTWYLLLLGALLGFIGAKMAKIPPSEQYIMPPRYDPYY